MSEVEGLASMVGHVITGIFLSEDKTSVVFETAYPRKFRFEAEGDCCSRSWFEHFSGVDALLGSNIRGFQELDLPEPEQPDQYDVIKSYGYRLITDKGFFEVDLRNESNGYYGGWIQGEREAGDYSSFKRVTEDF